MRQLRFIGRNNGEAIVKSCGRASVSATGRRAPHVVRDWPSTASPWHNGAVARWQSPSRPMMRNARANRGHRRYHTCEAATVSIGTIHLTIEGAATISVRRIAHQWRAASRHHSSSRRNKRRSGTARPERIARSTQSHAARPRCRCHWPKSSAGMFMITPSRRQLRGIVGAVVAFSRHRHR